MIGVALKFNEPTTWEILLHCSIVALAAGLIKGYN